MTVQFKEMSCDQLKRLRNELLETIASEKALNKDKNLARRRLTFLDDEIARREHECFTTQVPMPVPKSAEKPHVFKT
ncbi:hypothetical protein [Variovorax sp. PCZ-1]|uniref:hypothetical protein n=1 Tax=Variovorax sp. PCZ-1 TaxID=2835533 RepID=UPI001BCD74D9|nr:hypothetical protein [Variovorax sp. PCZ-1]MBS7806969.1 hypothetical protein [Variovorax sp. PCZ-1]